MRAPAAVAAALASGAALVACGDELSRSEYVERADAVCARVERDVREANAVAGSAATLDQLRPTLERTRGLLERALDELRELDPPGEIEDEVDRYLDDAQAVVDVIASAQDAGSEQAAEQLLRVDLARATALRRESAAAAGLDACAAQ